MPLVLTIYPDDGMRDRYDADGFEVDPFAVARAACPFAILDGWRCGDPDGHGYIMLESGIAASLSGEPFSTFRAACTAAVSALRLHGEAIAKLVAVEAVRHVALGLRVDGARPGDSPSGSPPRFPPPGSPPRFPPPLVGLARELGITLSASFREGWGIQWPPPG